MSANNKITIASDSPSIQTHLEIMQNVVQRMASNSSSCKAFCITLVSAVLVIVADKGKPEYTWIAFLPTVSFALLDLYYLGLEKGFRNSYNEFISKLHNNCLDEMDLYSVKPKGDYCELFCESIKSFSIWGFYIPLVILIYITKTIAIT